MLKSIKPVLGVFTVTLVWVAACSVSKMAPLPKSFPEFYKEGHRGAMGLMPENTIAAMKKGIEAGANVIELDVYLTKDKKVIVAHDPYVNVNYSLLADGKEIPKEEAQKYVWHQMNYDEIRKINVGTKHYPSYPQQQKLAAYMPLLEELIDSVETFINERNLPKIIYNIEFKTSLRYDSLGYNASPAALVDAVMNIVNSKNIKSHFYLQSFDVRILQVVHQKYPKIPLGFLTNSRKSFEENIQDIGFVPPIYSPHFSLVTKELVEKCKKQGIKIIPWTVNDKEKMKSLIALGVNGIITDYPNYFREIGKL